MWNTSTGVHSTRAVHSCNMMKLKPLRREQSSAPFERGNFLPQLYAMLKLDASELDIVAQLNRAVPRAANEFIADGGVVSCASIVQLFLLLTDPESSLEYQRQYLITYICFSRSELLLSMLATRYFVDVGADGVNVRDEEQRTQIRIRIIRIIDYWIRLMPRIFSGELISGLQMILASIRDDSASEERQSNEYKILKGGIDKLTGHSVVTVRTERKMPEPILPKMKEDKVTQIQCYDPIEVARQVSLIYSELFRKIDMDELLQAIWFCNKESTGNIQELVHYMNALSGYVSLSVLYGNTPKERAATFKFWIDVGAEFEKLNNFNGMFAVNCGLLHPSIKRLSKTMKVVEKTNETRRANFERMKQICDFSCDFKTYRSVIKKAVEPCVPFIGCFQKDIIYVQECYPSKINGLINFKKCIECYNLMMIIRNFQNIGYYFEPVPKLQQMILGLNEPAEASDLIQLSMMKEKKNTK